MEYVYHGSSTHNLNTIYPHESTHGNYVYATTDLVVATIFCKRCGDDVTYALYKAEDGKYNVVELLPHVFELMFNNDASIYTVLGTTFQDYRTGFKEVMSTQPVRVVAEEFIPNVLAELERLNDTGSLHLYRYPNKPLGFNPEEHLIGQRFGTYLKIHDAETFKNGLYRLAGYHPELIPRINEELVKNNVDIPPVDFKDLLYYYEHQLSAYDEDQTHERYLDSLLHAGLTTYPELSDQIYEIINKHGYDYKAPIEENVKQV